MNSNYGNTVNEICKKHKLFDQEKFNVFSVMHYPTDERRLHSRFISFLLDPNASHNKGAIFLNLFLKSIKSISLNDFKTDSITVYPTEIDKKEKDKIDILIIDKNNNREIIIENKIYAPDSNKLEEDGTITPQLIHYRSVRKKKKPNSKIDLIYLTLNGKMPSYYEKFEELHRISYMSGIRNWLKSCLKEDLSSELRLAIEQYRRLVLSITNDYELALDLKNSISLSNIDQAREFWYQKAGNTSSTEKIVLEQFKHIKWHTVHELYTLLKNGLEKTLETTVEGLTEKQITSLTHNNSKRGLRIHFTLYQKVFYISNDSKGFTMGIHNENKLYEDFSFNKKDKIVLSDFSDSSTFSLIDSTKSSQVVNTMINEMKLFVEKNR